MNNMLIDTNLLVYAIDQDSAFFSQAQNIISDSGVALFTTSKNLSEFLAVTTRIPRNAMPINDALTVINDFLTIFNILYPTEQSYKIFMDLLRKYQPSGIKIHDFEIVSIGLANGINRIATFNQKDFYQIKEIDLYPL